MDLIRNLPPNILLTFSFRLEESNKKNYNQLIQELIRLDYAEIRIGSMNSEDIKEFATRRYNMKISDLIADYLNMTIGEPLSLVSTFNIITRENLEPNIESFEKILPEALNPVKTIYFSLDDKSQSWANSLCQLCPPMPLSVIGCMLKETN